jgi:hypothetical protein
MRFLFGDSTPFPLGYNFLATLESFMATATRIVQLDNETASVRRANEETAASRVKGLEALEQFHNVVMRAVQDTAQKVHHAHALEYAQRVAEFASQYVEEHKRATLASNERESMQLRAEAERRITEQRQQLETFLKVARLPVTKTNISIRLTGEGKEHRHQMSAVFDNPDNIQTSFTLNASKAPAWSAPRRVSDFLQGVDLLVGVEKSWLRGTVTQKQQNVDDWIVTQADMSDESLELTLRRNLREKEMLVFHIRKFEGVLSGTVEHPGAPGVEAGAVGTQMQQADLGKIDKLWRAIRAATRDVIDHKDQLLGVFLDQQPVFEGGLVLAFVVRLVAMFAPTVREVAKRSPNEHELSLKIEHEGGRREEIYLRKDTLVNALHPLPASGRQVFAPLGLDSWVPSMTAAPPPVISSG